MLTAFVKAGEKGKNTSASTKAKAFLQVRLFAACFPTQSFNTQQRHNWISELMITRSSAGELQQTNREGALFP